MTVTAKSTDAHHVPCVLEGNGSRPSHSGDGYKESETMYTLNSTEHHAVAMAEKTTEKKQTVFDWHRQDTRMTELKDICVTASASWGAGGNNMPYVFGRAERTDPSRKQPEPRNHSNRRNLNGAPGKHGNGRRICADGNERGSGKDTKLHG